MRLAAVVNTFPLEAQGSIRLQLDELRRRGTQVSLFALAKERGEPNSRYFPTYLGYAWSSLPRRVIGHVGTARALSALSKSARRGDFTAFARDAASLLIPHKIPSGLSRSQADVIHCHFGEVGREVALSLRKSPPVPLVVSFYGNDAYRLPQTWGSDLFHPLFSRALAVLSLGPRMDERLMALGCPMSLLRRIPLTVDTDQLKFLPRANLVSDRPLKILSVAPLVLKKGVSVGIESTSLLQRRLGVPIEYAIAGTGPLLKTLRRQAETSPPGLSIRFLGNLSADEIHTALYESDVCLVPSLTTRLGETEGTPSIALEAMAAGRPLVASTSGDLPSLLGFGELGALGSEGDAGELASALESALSGGSAWRERLSAARLQTETHHSPEAVGENLNAVYRQLFH